MKVKTLLSIFILTCIPVATGCMTRPSPTLQSTTDSGSLAHQYGEEILAYMMQVVLGQAGDPEKRIKWSSRGLDQDLNLDHIAGIMSDPIGNKTAIMVHDPNILGLSKILYHYAPEMSQFAGSYSTSLYPATELIALRLFLLKRLRDDRQISIQALLNHRQLLESHRRPPSRDELDATMLTAEEFFFLQGVFHAKPWLFNSLTNPFLVEAFYKTGILTKDPFTAKIIAEARYRGTVCMPLDGPPSRDAIIIALLPSMTKEFIPTDACFTPSTTYTKAVKSLKTGIVAACRRIALRAMMKTAAFSAGSADGNIAKNLDRLIAEKVSFQTLNHRPLVIYPENAAEVVRDTCPGADFAVIILGRNVYQALHIDHTTDIYPKANRVYLDITDVKYGQVASEVSEIGRFLFENIKPWLSKTALKRTAA